MTPLQSLAAEAGIAVHWTDASGRRRLVSPETLRAVIEALGLAAGAAGDIADSRARLRQQRPSPLTVVFQGQRLAVGGRHLRLEAEDGTRHDLKVSDGEVWAALPPGYYRMEADRILAVAPQRGFQPDAKAWGVAAQLYGLRGSPGIGDFGALGDFCEDAARAGAAAVMLSPVHAVPAGAVSPYSPSSRLFLNPLYIPRRGRDRGDGLIDWPAASRTRLAALHRAFHAFDAQGGDPGFETFIRAGGAALRRHARAEAGAADEARFQLYLQWRADAALATAQARARAAGMAIGLISDVAVGVDPQGSEALGNDAMLQGLCIGAPPDAFNPDGQNWGLTTFSPHGLRTSGCRGFVETLRAAMRHAGGIRLDHAMSLTRLWVVPKGFGAAQGAYLQYPFETLLGLLCLESQRQRALVIAEDLGTVPQAFRRRIRRAGLLGMEVLWFAREGRNGFLPPSRWPAHSAALSSTHDLPTLAGWWRERDLDWRERIEAKPQDKARKRRARERRALWKALRAAGAKGAMPRAGDRFIDGVMTALAAAPSLLTLVTAEDLAGDIEQPNLPGTVTEHPNWRRRLGTARLFEKPAVRRRVRLLEGKP